MSGTQQSTKTDGQAPSAPDQTTSAAAEAVELPTDRNLDHNDLKALFLAEEEQPPAAPEAAPPPEGNRAASPENEDANPGTDDPSKTEIQNDDDEELTPQPTGEGNQAAEDDDDAAAVDPLLAELNGDDPAAAGADDDEDEPEAGGAWPETAQKRVNELTFQKKSAEEKLEAAQAEATQLREQLANASAPTLSPTSDQPLADIATGEQLQKV